MCLRENNHDDKGKEEMSTTRFVTGLLWHAAGMGSSSTTSSSKPPIRRDASSEANKIISQLRDFSESIDSSDLDTIAKASAEVLTM